MIIADAIFVCPYVPFVRLLSPLTVVLTKSLVLLIWMLFLELSNRIIRAYFEIYPLSLCTKIEIFPKYCCTTAIFSKAHRRDHERSATIFLTDLESDNWITAFCSPETCNDFLFLILNDLLNDFLFLTHFF